MDRITVYFPADGHVYIRWPKGKIPDRETLERVCEAIKEHRKTPSANGHSQKGLAAENRGSIGHNYDTASGAIRQELMEILLQLPAEDVEELNQYMREIIKGRA